MATPIPRPGDSGYVVLLQLGLPVIPPSPQHPPDLITTFPGVIQGPDVLVGLLRSRKTIEFLLGRCMLICIY